MKEKIILENILELSKKFIYIKSDPDNKKALDEILFLAKEELKNYTIENFEKDGVKSILVYNAKIRPEKFKIILNGHLDVIPGKDYQYKPKIIDNKMYGVGSMDMKSNVACLIFAFKEVANKINYPLGLQIVTDEEIGGFNGTKYQIEKGVNAEFVIAGETTNFNIVNKAKGIIWLEITFKGITAHGAYPWKGENAIKKASDFINSIMQKYPIPKDGEWKTSINISKIETSNNTFNKIPDDCILGLDIRYISSDKDSILNNIKEICKDGTMNIIANEPSLYVEEGNNFIQKIKNITKEELNKNIILYGANGSSDARHFSIIDCPGIEFGPIGGGIGTDEEWVDMNSLLNYFNILKNLLLSLD